jgi:xylulose-5-phosphate/fructose-6-phosphate phosphoketolase
MNEILSPKDLKKVNAYWSAAKYLSVGQSYLYDNPLLRDPLKQAHSGRTLGHDAGSKLQGYG